MNGRQGRSRHQSRPRDGLGRRRGPGPVVARDPAHEEARV